MTDLDLDLDAIEARAAAATEGPWSRDDEHSLSVAICYTPHVWALAHSGTEANAEFIAHARTDVPALVAALREARAGWYQNRDKADLCDAMIAERDEARAAIALAGEEIERASVEVARAHRALLASNAERNEAHAAIAAVRALCDHADSGLHAGLTMVSVAAVRGAILAALDARDDPSATTTIPIDVAREHAWLANYALEMLVDTGDGTYHPIADALAKVRDLLDPSATTEGGAS